MDDELPFYELPLAYQPDISRAIPLRRDIAYTDDGDPEALMDIYLPHGAIPEGGHPFVLFLHGGPLPPAGERPWPKEWHIFQDYGNLVAANGIAGVVINHRYIGYEGLVQAIADVQQALEFLSEQGNEFGLNGQRFAIWAFSGAGMLLSTLLDGQTPGLQALVAFYPMLDLTHILQAADVYSDDQLIALSPLSHIDRMSPSLPMYFARAGLDGPGLNRALDTFVKQALYHNLDLEMRNLPYSGHSFDIFEDSPAVQTTIQSGLNFIRGHLES